MVADCPSGYRFTHQKKVNETSAGKRENGLKLDGCPRGDIRLESLWSREGPRRCSQSRSWTRTDYQRLQSAPCRLTRRVVQKSTAGMEIAVETVTRRSPLCYARVVSAKSPRIKTLRARFAHLRTGEDLRVGLRLCCVDLSRYHSY
jgi:hypothetical protein